MLINAIVIFIIIGLHLRKQKSLITQLNIILQYTAAVDLKWDIYNNTFRLSRTLTPLTLNMCEEAQR